MASGRYSGINIVYALSPASPPDSKYESPEPCIEIDSLPFFYCFRDISIGVEKISKVNRHRGFIRSNYSAFDAVWSFFRINNMASEIVYINVAVIVSYISPLHISEGSLYFEVL